MGGGGVSFPHQHPSSNAYALITNLILTFPYQRKLNYMKQNLKDQFFFIYILLIY